MERSKTVPNTTVNYLTSLQSDTQQDQPFIPEAITGIGTCDRVRKIMVIHLRLILRYSIIELIDELTKNQKGTEMDKTNNIIRSSAAEYLTFIIVTGESDVNAIDADKGLLRRAMKRIREIRLTQVRRLTKGEYY